MSPTFDLLASSTFGVLAGVLSGFLGIGGGAILSPLLVFTLGLDQHRAQGISLAALVPPVGLPAVLAYRRVGVRIDVKLVVALVLGFLGGGLGGAWLAHRLPSRELTWAFALFLVVSAWRALAEPPPPPHASFPPRRAARWVGIPIGAAAGVMSGLLGVGGGLVALPLLRKVARLGRLEAQATTLAMLLPPIGLPAVYVYAREQGGLPWDLLAVVGLGFALGAGVGAALAGRVEARIATRVYVGFLGVAALMLVLR